MSDLQIVVLVDTTEGKQTVRITEIDIENLAEQKAKNAGWTGKQGRILRWFNPRIKTITTGDIYD